VADGTAERTAVPQPADRGTSAYIAEFIGTFALVFFVTMAVCLFVQPPSPEGLPQAFTDWSVIGLAHVFVLFMLIQTLALVSGAHFNPAVTVALTVIREIKPIDAAIYIVVQLAGATLGALATKLILVNFANAEALNYGAVGISDRLGGQIFFHGLSAEMIGTFFLLWAIVGVAVNPRSDRGWAALVIGGTLGLIVFVFGPLTGASFNPARAFGPALVANEWVGWDDFLVTYVLAPVVAAVISALVYFRMVIVPGKKGPGGMEPVG
jgi:glycerol uptake facilitator protein